MKGKILTAAFVAIGIFAASGYTAVAETPQIQAETKQNEGSLSGRDKLFMTQAAQTNLAEVRLSKLALERASSDEVKRYAQDTIEQHTQANNELKQLAAKKGVELPNELDAQHRQVESQLQQLSGANFDRAYMNAMYEDRGRTILVFQTQVEQGQDPETKAYADKFLPPILQYYVMAGNMVRTFAAQ